jgi:hypothetical protein
LRKGLAQPAPADQQVLCRGGGITQCTLNYPPQFGPDHALSRSWALTRLRPAQFAEERYPLSPALGEIRPISQAEPVSPAKACAEYGD